MKTLTTIAILALLLAPLAGCARPEDETELRARESEELDEEVEQAVEKTGEAIEEGAERLSKGTETALEEAGREVRKGTRKN